MSSKKKNPIEIQKQGIIPATKQTLVQSEDKDIFKVATTWFGPEAKQIQDSEDRVHVETKHGEYIVFDLKVK